MWADVLILTGIRTAIRIGLVACLLGAAQTGLADTGRSIRLGVDIVNTGAASLGAGSVSVALPLCTQAVRCVRDDRQEPLACELTTAPWSYDALAVRVPASLRPYERMLVTIVADCPQIGGTTGIPESALGASPGIDPQDPAIVATILDTAPETTVVASMAELMTIVRQRLHYAGYRARTLSASDALDQGVGDCTEYALLLAALSRVQGIPARLVAGYVMKAGELGVDPAAYHNWIEYHDGTRWQVADPLYDAIGAEAVGYVAFFRFGPDDGLDEGHRRFWIEHRDIRVHLR